MLKVNGFNPKWTEICINNERGAHFCHSLSAYWLNYVVYNSHIIEHLYVLYSNESLSISLLTNKDNGIFVIYFL